ncbi:uncharacterized protein LOC119073661 [Bradysia coprophila]|uniref:uncharacterized protein LOC119073661 n=1 Tax=Bradysia coprophila TaxID=38358 RepID=UPI00187DB667|nr:uncharacterized protein LOC119073661 [Bradysia coprophila]
MQCHTATVPLHGFGKDLIPLLSRLPYKKDDESTNSYTVVYVKNARPPKKPSASNSIGARQKGDRLIHFESRNVTNISRFPSRAFEYSGDESITYVRFAFNSPTAMALINTTFISEESFNSVAYDMNTEHFVANISIYGFDYLPSPYNYVNLLGMNTTNFT